MSKKQKAPQPTADKGRPIEALVGFVADAVYVYGGASFQPADRRFVLEQCVREGAQLEMTWRFTVGAAGTFELMLEHPEGIETSDRELVVRRTSRLRYADGEGSLEAVSSDGKSVTETDSSGLQPSVYAAQGKPALKIN